VPTTGLNLTVGHGVFAPRHSFRDKVTDRKVASAPGEMSPAEEAVKKKQIRPLEILRKNKLSNFSLVHCLTFKIVTHSPGLKCYLCSRSHTVEGCHFGSLRRAQTERRSTSGTPLLATPSPSEIPPPLPASVHTKGTNAPCMKMPPHTSHGTSGNTTAQNQISGFHTQGICRVPSPRPFSTNYQTPLTFKPM